MEFIFKPEKLGTELTEQVAMVLAKRIEISSRQKMPELWDKIDKMNSNKAPEDVLYRRKIRHIIYGIALIVMGIFLFVPGLMEPQELFIPLIAGAIAFVSGIFAVIPRKTPAEKNEKKAEKLIKSINSSIKGGSMVIFCEEGIIENGTLLMEYKNLEDIMETRSIFFITDGKKALVLRKTDLVVGTMADFILFLKIKTDREIRFCG